MYFWKQLQCGKEYFRKCARRTLLCDQSSCLVPYVHLPVDSKYRADIDGLRGIAVFGVLLFHVFPTHLTGGFVGVDVFFVISGYLISSIICNELDRGSFNFFQFYCRRVQRIFPSLIIVIVVCYLAGWHLFLPVEYKKLAAHITAASTFSSNFLLYRESGYFDEASDSKPLLHLWSLGIEEQFYIIWPLLFYMLRKKKLNLLTFTIGLTLSSFTLNIVKIKTNNVQTFYWPTTRAWELLIGACLACKLSYTNNNFKSYIRRLDDLFNALIYSESLEPNGATLLNITSTTGVLLIVLPMCFLTKQSVFPGWWAIAPTIGTSLLIFVGPTPWINRMILSSHLLVGMGRISYALYLWHWPLLVYTRIFIGQQISYYIRVAIIFFSVMIAWITYAFVEKPFRGTRFRKVKFVFLCIVMAGIGFIGYHTYQADGLPHRFSQVTRDIINYEKYEQETWKNYRWYICLLEANQDESKFGACEDNKEKPASNGVILWGDSYAAHLYPGIAAIRPVVRVTQLTSGLCPPLLGFGFSNRRYCKQINDYILNRISYEKPNTVILAASWSGYKWKNLVQTVANLRNASIKNIYLVGPTPEWNPYLPKCLYDYFSRDTLHRVPDRMHTCLSSNINNLDKEMQAFAAQTKINYISAYQILCNSDGCLTRVGRNISRLITYDYGHLTTPASTFIVSHFPETLLSHLSTI